MNLCSKPGCTRSGAALLSYDYDGRLASLEDPPSGGEVSPHLYVLCGQCAERLRPPQGWLLEDRRTAPPLFVATGERAAEGGVQPFEEPEPVASRRQLFFGYSA